MILFRKEWSSLKKLMFLAGSALKEGWRTVTGAIASFVATKVTALPMEFDLVPIQDLHGQANPYPPGGGKNKLYLPAFSTDDYFRINNLLNLTVDVANQTVTFECRSTGQTVVYLKHNYEPGSYAFSYNISNYEKRFMVRCFDENGNILTDSDITISGLYWNSYYSGFYKGSDSAFTIPNTVHHFWIGFGVAGDTAGSSVTLSKIQLEQGSSVTDYAPYSNICPITGHDGFTRIRTGKNLFDGEYTNCGITATGGVYSISNSDSRVAVIPCKPNTTYTATKIEGSNRFIICSADTYPVVGTQLTNYYNSSIEGTESKSFTTNGSAKYIVIGVTTSSAKEEPKMQVELGSTASDFEAYNGSSIETTFPTPPGTVYGGHVKDNGDGTYDLTVDRVNAVFDGSDDESWLSTTDNLIQLYALKLGNNGFVVNDECISNEFKNESAISVSNGIVGFRVFNSGGYNDARIAVRPPWAEVGSTVQQLKTWLASNPLQVVYKLSNPTVYTGLTLTALQSLIGQNHVWVDNADEVSVEYWGH